jgi:phosphatidate cytidylyltransferase
MKRVLTALVLIPVFCYLILWAPQWAFLGATALVGIFCFREYGRLVSLHQIQEPGLFGFAAGLLLLFLPQQEIVFVVVVALVGMALSLRSADLTDSLPYAAALILGVLYVFGSLRFAIELRAISKYWVFFALSLNWVGDIAALYVGRALGRHKLAPHVSPGKSWEGSIASVAASVIYGAVYFPRLLPAVPMSEALVVAAIGNIAGQFGDLCESALKRGAGVKDSGTFLPGHGGWLDRVDSNLFALPVVYLLASTLRW